MKKLLVLMCLLAFVATANAATVKVYMVNPDGSPTYTVYARMASDGEYAGDADAYSDNSGIAIAEVEITGATLTNVQCLLPKATGIGGFTLLRSGSANPIGGAQDAIASAGTLSKLLVFGLGKGDVDLSDQLTGAGTQVIDTRMPIGSFEVSSGTPAIGDADISVFNTGMPAGPDVQGPVDTYEANVVVIPEPATMALLSLGGLALLRRRK